MGIEAIQASVVTLWPLATKLSVPHDNLQYSYLNSV